MTIANSNSIRLKSLFTASFIPRYHDIPTSHFNSPRMVTWILSTYHQNKIFFDFPSHNVTFLVPPLQRCAPPHWPNAHIQCIRQVSTPDEYPETPWDLRFIELILQGRHAAKIFAFCRSLDCLYLFNTNAIRHTMSWFALSLPWTHSDRKHESIDDMQLPCPPTRTHIHSHHHTNFPPTRTAIPPILYISISPIPHEIIPIINVLY